MLKQKLQDVLNEPACATNQAKSTQDRRKGCSAKALVPGAAAGGCAFDGAKVALQPIADAAHLVHGPIAPRRRHKRPGWYWPPGVQV